MPSKCVRCGGSLLYDPIERQYRCLACSRPYERGADVDALRAGHPREDRRRDPKPIGPTPAPPGYLRVDEIAKRLDLTTMCVWQRLKARGVAYRKGKRRVLFVAEADVPTLAVGVKEWRERGKVG